MDGEDRSKPHPESDCRPLSVVKPKPLFKVLAQLEAVVKRPQVKILILDGPPQPLDEIVVLDSATAIRPIKNEPALFNVRGVKDFYEQVGLAKEDFNAEH